MTDFFLFIIMTDFFFSVPHRPELPGSGQYPQRPVAHPLQNICGLQSLRRQSFWLPLRRYQLRGLQGNLLKLF